jgi:thymidylate synthase (FAD)
MKVKLVGITKPVNQNYGETTEDIVSYCARVSNPKNQKNFTTSSNLLSYMIREGHWSPFEMVHLTIEIETTRDIARQILRHRSFSFQEFSQRYADPTKELKFVNREARLQDPKNRQNSIELDALHLELDDAWKRKQLNIVSSTMNAYRWAIDNGIAKEQARAVLPEGLTESRLYMSGNLRSWIHYCQLRMGNGTQLEHIKIANECWNILEEEFPEVTDAINNL